MSSSAVCMAKVSFLVHLLLEGLQRSSGVLFLATRDWLGCSRQLAAIPFTLSRIVSGIVGIFIRLHADDKKIRSFIGPGCFLSAAGLSLCFLATDITWQSVFWGVIFGAGIGITSPILVSELIKKKSTSARSSIRLSGPSFGCIVLPFVISALDSLYGLNGSYIVLSGIVLNCLPLILISTYQIQFQWPKINWRLRKRSKQYEMSEKKEKFSSVSVYKTRDVKEFCNQSFIQNLEPDTSEKVSENDSQNIQSTEYIDILQPIIEAKMKMAKNHTNDREAFGLERSSHSEKCCQHNELYSQKLSELVEEVNTYEKNRTMYEESFSDTEIIPESSEVFTKTNTSDKQEQETVPSDIKDEELSERKETKTSEQTENEMDKHQDNSPPVISSTHQNFQVKKVLPHTGKDPGINFPLELKVHVVECTITTIENYSVTKENNVHRKGYRRHSNSLITAHYDNIDFTQLLTNSKSTPFQKQQWNHASRMCLISEEAESESGTRDVVSERQTAGTQTGENSFSNARNLLLETLQGLAKPSCLTVIYASVIYEFSMAVLLTIFADFARSTGDEATSANLVLAVYGLGGIMGRMSFTYWGSKLLVDGSHAAAAVIFMLNGLAVAGILWSASVAWLSGFFALLGFVESGVVMTLPKLVSDFTDKQVEKQLSFMCKCLSIAAFLCIPCAIGQSRDVVGDYDGLLQVISCMSVLCAVLCYFLPKWNGGRNISDEGVPNGEIVV